MAEGGRRDEAYPINEDGSKTRYNNDDDDDNDIAAVSVVVAAALKTTINRQWLTTRQVIEGGVMAVRGVGKEGEGGEAR